MLYSTHLQLIILCTFAILKPSLSLNLSFVHFNEAFTPLYGNQNVIPSNDGKSVEISLNQFSTYGSGFISQSAYNHGLFTASIKLPNNSYSAGIVATFHLLTNEPNRNEIDLEFLGHVEGEEWVLQTNFYGNGSLRKGREERYTLPFDPSERFHNYTILWNTGRIVYYVDGWPIREVINVEGMNGEFPSKPMYLYATIWDGSDWATHGGKSRLDIQRGPFVTGYSNFIVNGCRVTTSECDVEIPSGVISSAERIDMDWYRMGYMTYSYCNDMDRYPKSLPECGVEGPESGPPAQ